MFILTMRDENGTWYVERCYVGQGLTTERSDAWVFYNQAYASAVAKQLEAKLSCTNDWTRGPVKVRRI